MIKSYFISKPKHIKSLPLYLLVSPTLKVSKMNQAPCTTPLLHRSHRPSGQIEIILTLILFHPFCCSSTTSNILSINIKCHRAPETFSWLCSSAFSSPLWDRLQVSQRKVQQTGRGCSRTFWWIILLVNDGLTPFGSVLKKYHCSSIPTLGQCTNQGYRATRAVKNIFPYMVEKSKTNMKDKRQRIKQGKAHLPHMSLRRWAGNVPWRSTTSLPYLSCNFRLYNNICFMQGNPISCTHSIQASIQVKWTWTHLI